MIAGPEAWVCETRPKAGRRNVPKVDQTKTGGFVGESQGLGERGGHSGGNAGTFIRVRMDVSGLVSIVPYSCSPSRTIFRCFRDTMPSATARPCSRDSPNPMPQLRVY